MSPQARANAVVARLGAMGSRTEREGMARFAIPSDKAFGIRMHRLQALAKELGRDHALALALWKTGWYEARMLCAYVDEPAKVTAAQMEAWSRDFDNWAIVDTLAFSLFDRTPHAWAKVHQWSTRRDEFRRRAAFALLWALALHDRETGDKPFLGALPLLEHAATDGRNFVKKAVGMALRAVGRRSPALGRAATSLATRLAASEDAAARWVGKDALRVLRR